MKLSTSFVFLTSFLQAAPSFALYTWPSAQIDEMEDIMYLQSGYASRGFRNPITPCSTGLGGGRYTAAEWVRVAFHDVSNYDAATQVGGMDASVMWETDYAPNVGNVFNSTFQTMQEFYNIRASMSDLFALSMYAAARACGGLTIPFRAGRIDAVSAGPDTGPVPSDTTANLTSKFAAAGNNVSTMIKLTACGHSFGGVHGNDFPNIVGNSSASYSVSFDTTPSMFDPRIVTEYLGGNTSNPLVVGPEVTNSDKRVFEADGNVTMKALIANSNSYSDICRETFTAMINTVAKNVTLTDAFSPIPVKPSDVQLTLNQDGSVMFSGEIRVLTTGSSSESLKVTLNYADRNGRTSSSYTVSLTEAGDAYGFDDLFKFYNFSTKLPPSGISKFTVSISSSKGTQSYDNNGSGFPVQDEVFFQYPQSCLIKKADANGNYNLTVVAAVRDSSNVTLDVVAMTPQHANAVVAPRLQPTSVVMTKWMSNIGGSDYSLFSGTYNVAPEYSSTTFDVVSGSLGDMFKKTAMLSGSCASL